MQIIVRRAKAFMLGEKSIMAAAGPLPQSFPDWVKGSPTYWRGVQDGSIREILESPAPPPPPRPLVRRVSSSFPDLKPFFRHATWRPMGHSGGALVGSDFTDKKADDPVFADYKNCGFWTVEEAGILFSVASEVKGCWLDIGGLTGWTAAHLAAAGCRVYSVDPMYANAEFLRRAEENLTAAGTRDSVSLWACRSGEFLTKTRRKFDGVIVDGDHKAPGPLRDAEQTMARVEENGAVLLHDLRLPDVRAAFEALARSGWKPQEFATTHGVAAFRRRDA